MSDDESDEEARFVRGDEESSVQTVSTDDDRRTMMNRLMSTFSKGSNKSSRRAVQQLLLERPAEEAPKPRFVFCFGAPPMFHDSVGEKWHVDGYTDIAETYPVPKCLSIHTSCMVFSMVGVIMACTIFALVAAQYTSSLYIPSFVPFSMDPFAYGLGMVGFAFMGESNFYNALAVCFIIPGVVLTGFTMSIAGAPPYDRLFTLGTSWDGRNITVLGNTVQVHIRSSLSLLRKADACTQGL